MPAAAAAATQFSPSKNSCGSSKFLRCWRTEAAGGRKVARRQRWRGQLRHCAENGREQQRGRRSHCGECTVCTTWHTYNPHAAWIKASFINNPWEEGLHNDSWKDSKQNIHGKGNPVPEYENHLAWWWVTEWLREAFCRSLQPEGQEFMRNMGNLHLWGCRFPEQEEDYIPIEAA